MTKETFKSSVSLWKDMLLLGGIVSGFATLILSVFFAGIVAIWGPTIREASRDWLGVTKLYEELVSYTGGNKITSQPEGMSYVREPVHIGQPLEVVLHIGRTERGAACQLLESTPLYTDDNFVVIPGETRQPVQQLNTDVVRRELTLKMPETLEAGRVSLQLQLKYGCADAVVYELTNPLIFQLLP